MRDLIPRDMIGMIVDPNRNMQSIIAGMLRTMTIQGRRIFKEIKKAHSSQEAWRQTGEKEPVDIIICDIHMKGTYDGIKLLEDFSRDPLRKFIPFIMTTAVADESMLPALIGSAREWGAHYLLVKPFARVTIEEKVRKVLEKMQSSEEQIYRKILEAPPLEAIATIAELEEKGFRAPKLSNIAGEKHLEAGEKEKAAERFEQAVSDSETVFLSALKNHASIQEELGNADEAVTALEKLDHLSPLDASRKIKIGELFLELGNEEKGREAFDQAVAFAKKNGNAPAVREKVELALTRKGLENPDIWTIKQNLNDLRACNDVALRLRKEGRFDRAEACYDFILSHHPNHPVVLFNKAMLFIAQKRHAEAIPALEAALVQDPKFEKAASALEQCRRSVQPPPA
ncbi:MAG: tetratricopeptide repeat protein [Syntrophobacteraceae bacterium]